MKRIKVSIILLLSIPFYLNAQYIKPTEVPIATKATLEHIFPNVKLPLWKKVVINLNEAQKYEATFIYNSKRTWVTLDTIGNLFIIENMLDKDSFPPLANEYISDHHKFTTVTDSRKIILSDSTLILIIVKGNKFYNSILFKEDGTLIRDKSNAFSYLVSLVASTILIPDIGIFKPFKLRDSMIGPRNYNFGSKGK